MARKKQTDAYTYQPDGRYFSPGMRPGDTVTVRSEEHRAQLEASPCFHPVRDNKDLSDASRDGGE